MKSKKPEITKGVKESIQFITSPVGVGDENLNIESRHKKAKKIMRIIEEFGHKTKVGEICLDVGCGSGYITKHLTNMFDYVIGIDNEPEYRTLQRTELISDKLSFIGAEGMELPLTDESIDIVVFNHVYIYFKDQNYLFEELRRVLKKGGIIYFAGANAMSLKPLYDKKKIYPKTYFGLRLLLRTFEVKDYTLEVIKNPNKYSTKKLANSTIGMLISKLPGICLLPLLFITPSWIWILKKR
jgi:ubiquinone/menaquinone biosynthesis C-methylase UbiE